MTSFYYDVRKSFTTKAKTCSTTRMLYDFSFLFKFLFPLENSRANATNYSTKENRQIILVVVVIDTFMQMPYTLTKS